MTTSKTYAYKQRTEKEHLDSNYSAISIDTFSSKTTIGKYSWYFKNSFLCKPDFLSAKKNLLSLLKN